MDKPLTIKSARTLQLTYNLPISRTSKFWEGLKEGKIYATKCKKCDKLHFPPVADCGNCSSSEVTWMQLDGQAAIETYTQIVIKPPSFSKESSPIVAIAQLKEGVRALAWLTGVALEDVKIGMNVKLVADVRSDGRVAYKFVPI